MKKILVILMALTISLRAMEQGAGLALRLRPKHFRIFLPKQQIAEMPENKVMSADAANQDELDSQIEKNISWNTLPEELKLYILSFIPKMGCYESIKNLLVVNHALKDLVTSSQFLKMVAYEIVLDNPARALDIYAWAMVCQNVFLAKLIFEPYFTHYTDLHEVDENQVEQNKKQAAALIEAMIIQNLKAARDIFCAAAAQGNKKLVKLFISVTSAPQEESPIYKFCVATGMPAWFNRQTNSYRCSYNTSLLDAYGYKSPLVAAVTCRQKKIIKLLVRAKASLRMNGNFMSKFTIAKPKKCLLDDLVLSIAFLAEDKEILKLLISLIFNCESTRDHTGGVLANYFLHAISIGNQEIVGLFLFDLKLFHINELINFEYIPGIKDCFSTHKYTPLMIAAAYGRDDIVLYFLNHGANVNVKGSSRGIFDSITGRAPRKETASMVAKQNGYQELSNLLRLREDSLCTIS